MLYEVITKNSGPTRRRNMRMKNREKNRTNSTKRPPSATGVRLTRLAQTLAVLAAVKLAAICMLWLPPTPPAPQAAAPQQAMLHGQSYNFV